MAWQLIFTSAPRGLSLGRSGFCTVARHQDIKDGLVTEIERLSTYHHFSSSFSLPNPLIASHRIIGQREATYHLLSRITDCGLDYTSRTNHIAHHLVFTQEEIQALPSPARILALWTGWRSEWKDEPHFFKPQETFIPSSIIPPSSMRANAWEKLTGDAGKAALLAQTPGISNAVLITRPGEELSLLPLFEESLLLTRTTDSNLENTWTIPFTTFLQPTDSPQDFCWKGSWTESPVYQNSLSSAPYVLDITRPTSIPSANDELSECARSGDVPGKIFLPDKIVPLSSPVAEPQEEKIPKLSTKSPASSHTKETIPPFPSTQASRKKSSHALWMALASGVIIAGGIGFGLLLQSTEPQNQTPSAIVKKSAPSFPTQLPPPPAQTSPVEEKAIPPLPPNPQQPEPAREVKEPTPNPTLLEENLDRLDASGLPKRKTFVLFGTLNNSGIFFPSGEELAEFKSVLARSETARFWRVTSGLQLNPSEAEKLEQRIPGTPTIKPGVFYNSSAKQILSISLSSDPVNIKSQELAQGILAFPSQNSAALQLALTNKENLGQLALLNISSSKLEIRPEGDSTVLAVRKEFWNDFSSRIRFPQFGNGASGYWQLTIQNIPSNHPITSAQTIPYFIFGSAKTKNDLLKAKQEHEQALAALEKQSEKNAPKLKAIEMLFAPSGDFYNLGLKVSGLTTEKIQQEINRVQNEITQTASTGRENRRQKSISSLQVEQLDNIRKILTFETYLSSLSPLVKPENAVPRHYADYMVAVLKAVEPSRGYCIGTDGSGETAADEISSYRWSDIPRLFSKSNAQEEFYKKVSDISVAWNQIFSADAIATLSPLLEAMRQDPSGKSLDELLKQASTKKLHSQAISQILPKLKKYPSTIDEISNVNLEWVSGSERYLILHFQPETP